MQPREFYQAGSQILNTNNREVCIAEFKQFPTRILELLSHNVPLQIFPGDNEANIIKRANEQLEQEYRALSRTQIISIFSLQDEYKKLNNSADNTTLIAKNNLIEKMNTIILQYIDELSPIWVEKQNMLYLEMPGRKNKGKLTRLPIDLINRLNASDKPLVSVNLYHNDLYFFPSALLQFTKINVLNLSDNHLSNFPDDFYRFNRLQILNLAKTTLSNFLIPYVSLNN